ncbi:putative lipoprotein YkyA [Lentibacillus sp. JNUCC-1]|uniref:YkyA family protein n=1 Tax=Lentibacillus sp. JNUCC-1 TaxID=2654513 RepID=UPI00132873DE|nr:putative lipoprotein YkyA [Lentibacillus sp. JNUCC-1]
MPYKRTILITAFMMIISFLSACTGTSTSEKIYDHLEKTIELEEDFEAQQKPIVELEKQEQAIYKEIIEIGMDDFDKIKSLADDALDIIEQRREKLDTEKESINKAKKEFSEIESLVKDIEDEKVKEQAKEMTTIMDERYEAYDQLYNAYTDSLNKEEEMYTMLKDKDLEQEQLSEQISKVNESYQAVLEANETFNEHTVKYNELKKAFYDAAGIEVESSEKK